MQATSQATPPPVAYTVREAADALRCSTTHIYTLIERGELRRVKVGSRTIIPAKEIDRILDEGTE